MTELHSSGFHWLVQTTLILVFVFGAVLILISLMESWFIYFPDRSTTDLDRNFDILSRSSTVSSVENVTFETADSLLLHGWYCSARGEKGNRPVVLFFHGNAGNLPHRLEILSTLLRLPADVFIYDYRGYGRSQGKPSEKGLYRDGAAAFDDLTQRRSIPANRILLYGESLGGAVAAQVAVEKNPGGLILQSTFTSIRDMAAAAMPWVPPFLIRTRMDTVRKIPFVRCPILVIHGTKDDIVPESMGKALWKAAGEKATFLEISGAGHNDIDTIGSDQILSGVREFIDSLN
ncbi:MAG TPA: alpha/beta hydrolase [Thermoanaerobaculia bacterium]|nr:alpha/beta hydrolase [Thermoanaerobaculia bacterium]HUM29816.1 alpha/beta hydrolase [Thermoanaerobaculia bacterium]HXK68091.1 alpha/beta hydrolase [Thermoanaerobaculia bacterium]